MALLEGGAMCEVSVVSFVWNFATPVMFVRSGGPPAVYGVFVRFFSTCVSGRPSRRAQIPSKVCLMPLVLCVWR